MRYFYDEETFRYIGFINSDDDIPGTTDKVVDDELKDNAFLILKKRMVLC